MKFVQIICLVCLGAFFASCSGATIKSDYNPSIDFAALKTYDWMRVPEDLGISDLDLTRLKKAVDTQLQAKGHSMASENPDFLIAVHFGVENKVRVSNAGYGYHYGGYYGSTGVRTYQYDEGTLVLDFVAPDSKTLIWRGSATGELRNLKTPERREEEINKVVEKILKNFPPK